MENLFEALKKYNTFRIDEKLMLGVDITNQSYPYYLDNERVPDGEIIFIKDKISKICPFIGAERIEWIQNDNIIEVTVYYYDEEFDTEIDEVFKIECFNDISRTDNIQLCEFKNINFELLKKFEYLDTDQSRYIGDKKYYVVDLFRLGILNDKQEKQLKDLFLLSNKGKLHKDSSTLCYTDEGTFMVWDYLKAEPISY